MSNPPHVLTIAGTDPSGGAGVPVDLQVARDHDCHGLSAVAAVVWQNTSEVRGFEAVGPEVLAAQIEAVFEDLDVDAAKTGMLATAANVRVVAEMVDSISDAPPLVVDPVLVEGGRGAPLADSGLAEAVREELFEVATLVTPNVPEAEALLGREISSRSKLEEAARRLVDRGARAVLLKAGHLPGAAERDRISDVFAERSESGIEIRTLQSLARVEYEVRGTGCQLSAAIASRLAAGESLREAIEGGRRYLNRMMRDRAREIGGGRRVVVRADAACGREGT